MKSFFKISFILPTLVIAQVWTATYNGPANNHDEAWAIIIDSINNVYVTGRSMLDNRINHDFCTIKYNSDGEEEWVARYNGPSDTVDEARAIGLDESLNVYITGRSWDWTNKSDIVTIKYNQQGMEQWVRRYNGPANDEDHPYAMAVSPNGDVYVGGYRSGVTTNYDCCLIKYNSQGDSLWIATYNGPDNSNDWIWALVIDDTGNCYVTGYSGGINTSLDIMTIKFNPAGETVWVARYDGSAHDYDRGAAIAINDLGDVWVTGYCLDTINQQEFVTIRYNSDGSERWVRKYNGPANGYDRGYAIVIDANDNSYVTGSSIGTTTYSDIVTIKYDPDGNEQWLARYDGLANNIDIGERIALDSSGNICVIGHSQNITTGNDFVTIKYNPLGETCWVIVYNDPGNLDDIPSAITIDNMGYIYVTGFNMSHTTSRDYYTIKYYPSGLTVISKSESNKIFTSSPKIFPNPAKNIIYVSSSQLVQVFNISGQLVTTLKPGINKIQNLSKGIYFAKDRADNLSKFVVLTPD